MKRRWNWLKKMFKIENTEAAVVNNPDIIDIDKSIAQIERCKAGWQWHDSVQEPPAKEDGEPRMGYVLLLDSWGGYNINSYHSAVDHPDLYPQWMRLPLQKESQQCKNCFKFRRTTQQCTATEQSDEFASAHAVSPNFNCNIPGAFQQDDTHDLIRTFTDRLNSWELENPIMGEEARIDLDDIPVQEAKAVLEILVKSTSPYPGVEA